MGTGKPQTQVDYLLAPFDSIASLHEYQVPQLSLVPVGSNLRSWGYRGVKRVIDITCSTAMIVVCIIPGILIALAILITTEGPVFYRETRIGRNRRPFRIWKFRSMAARGTHFIGPEVVRHNEILSRWRTHKDAPDPRITKVGKFLRKWSLDELPQLFNVLRGEMSLVGPRPVVEAELQLYRHLEGFYLAATPGLSGLWQVSGRSNLTFPARAQLDASYVQTWSLGKDFVILGRTIPAVLRRVGAR